VAGIEARSLNARFHRPRHNSPTMRLRRTGPVIEALIHVSDIRGPRSTCTPADRLEPRMKSRCGSEVDAFKRRISLGLKQTMPHPWESVHRENSRLVRPSRRVKTRTEFGLFLGLEGYVTAWLHLSDLDWKLPGRAGDRLRRRATWARPCARMSMSRGAHLAGRQALRATRRRTPADVPRRRRGDLRVLEVKEAASSPDRRPVSHLHQAFLNWRASAPIGAPSVSRSAKRSTHA